MRGTKAGPGRAVAEALEAARRLEALGHEPPTILAFHPVTANPFQPQLYRQTWQNGLAPVPLHRIEELDELVRLPALGIRTVLHLHWTHGVLAGIDDEATGRAAIAGFLARIDRFTDAGGKLVWTVHNVLPHDARFHRLEAELQQAIVDRSVAVHILAAGTVNAVADWFTIPPDKVVHVPLPSYRGVYQDIYSRDEARHRLGIAEDEVVYGLFGALKPYKGLAVLLDAFDAVTADHPRRRRLLVAGAPDRAEVTAAFIERCRDHPLVTLHARRIPDDEMQLFLRATDVAVLPYEDVLNSSVLFLVLTFGLPVITPATGGIAEEMAPTFGRTYDAADPGSLAAAIRAADELLEPGAREQAREAAIALAAEHDPDRIGEAFARGLLSRVFGDPVLPYGRR
ncbi:MAG: glycosyltransferase [Candidatus Limnocylindrales bacterium]